MLVLHCTCTCIHCANNRGTMVRLVHPKDSASATKSYCVIIKQGMCACASCVDAGALPAFSGVWQLSSSLLTCSHMYWSIFSYSVCIHVHRSCQIMGRQHKMHGQILLSYSPDN